MKINLTEQQMENIEEMEPSFPFVVHHDKNGDGSFPWHWHEEIELNYVESGSLDIVTTEQTFHLKTGDAGYMNPNVLARYDSFGKSDTYSLLFHPVLLCGHYKSVFETKYVNPVIQNRNINFVLFRHDNPRDQKIISKIHELCLLQKTPYSELMIRNKLSDFWILLMNYISEMEFDTNAVRSLNQERLLAMLMYIHNHYADKITLAEIAAAASISERECIRCFNSCLHETPFDYVLGYRIDTAKKMLKNPRRSITDIAVSTGFSGSSYFSKTFREQTGMTPTEYRHNVNASQS